MATPLLVCDFDGTITLRDMGNALCERFADPEWVSVRAEWRRGELTLPQAQTRMWALIREDRASFLQAIDELGTLRAGADELFAAAADGVFELVIASGGFRIYIEHLLGARLAAVSATYCNTLELRPDGAVPGFPFPEFARDPYGIDKAVVLDRYADGRRMAFAGDGYSDRSVANRNDTTLFAVRGSPFEKWCNEAGTTCVPFDDLREIVDALT